MADDNKKSEQSGGCVSCGCLLGAIAFGVTFVVSLAEIGDMFGGSHFNSINEFQETSARNRQVAAGIAAVLALIAGGIAYVIGKAIRGK